MNPYAEIRKVPLDYNGIQSSAFAVQMNDVTKGWKEVGTVGRNYMLLPNTEVKDAALEVAGESVLNWEHDKTFFDGKRFIYSLKSEEVLGEIEPGDDVSLGMQFWNSYDGSKSFGFSLMLFRLICTNGMMSKDHFNTFRFKHEPTSENWDESLEKVTTLINNASSNGSVDTFIQNLRDLKQYTVSIHGLGRIRHNHLQDLPVGLWGSIVDRFTDPNGEYSIDQTGWGLLNASTDLLWHKEKPTVASYDQNAIIVDGLCNAIAA